VRFVGQFFLTVIFVSFIELFLLIEVSQRFGLLFTLFSCVLTGMIGGAFVRSQGLTTWLQIQKKSAQGQLPAEELLGGVMLFLVGILLITPGYFTDVLGFLVLIPALRKGVARLIYHRLRSNLPMTPKSILDDQEAEDPAVIIDVEAQPIDQENLND